MRVREVRRLLDGFLVFVNTEMDVKCLTTNPKFSLHATYKFKKFNSERLSIAYEFAFKLSEGTVDTISNAKEYVKSILDDYIKLQKMLEPKG